MLRRVLLSARMTSIATRTGSAMHLPFPASRALNLVFNNNNAASTTTTTTAPTTIISRSFSKKINKQGGGGNKIAVFHVFSEDLDEIEEVEEENEPGIFVANPGNDIGTFVKEYAKASMLPPEDVEGLKIFNKELKIFNSEKREFQPLANMNQVTQEQKRRGRVYIVHPEEGDDEEYDDNDDDEEYDDDDGDEYERDMMGDDDEDDEDEGISSEVERLAKQMIQDGWKRHEDGIHLVKEGNTVSTKQVILDLARDNLKLQDLLVENIGALDHLATCVHFDFVWELEVDLLRDANIQEAAFQEKK